MKSSLITFLALSISLLFFAGCSVEQSGTFPVLKVIDGDTIVVLREGKDEKIRLLRINTPERDKKFYWEAREAMRDLVMSRHVRLEFEIPGQEERDAHGRLLAYVFYKGTNVNVEMVRMGFSKFWTKYGTGRYEIDFLDAQSDAISNNRGIWR